MADIIRHEKDLVEYIIQKLGRNFSLESFRQEYIFYSTDVTHAMDTDCKHYLMEFFAREAFPSLTLSIKIMASILTSDIILRGLQKSLAAHIQSELISRLRPCMRLFEFSKRKQPQVFPVITYFIFSKKVFFPELAHFLKDENKALECISYINSLVSRNTSPEIKR